MIPRLRKKSIVFGFVFMTLSYSLIRIQSYKHVFSSTIRDTSAVKVWEYVSDFSNMKNLIPNMIFFKIESEHGDYENWKYRVYYEEYLAQLTFLTNFAWASYETKKLSENKYTIHSSHQTCFGTSLFCLYTDSVFEVEGSANSPDATYTEIITYQCPVILKIMCEREVRSQREHMKAMLENVFEKQ